MAEPKTSEEMTEETTRDGSLQSVRDTETGDKKKSPDVKEKPDTPKETFRDGT